MELRNFVSDQKENIESELKKVELAHGEILYHSGQCQLLAQTANCFSFIVSSMDADETVECELNVENELLIPKIENAFEGWDKNTYACLLTLENELEILDTSKIHEEHLKYTREGMIKRVLQERKQKAQKADYKIKWADNIYGDHILSNNKGVKYKLFLRDFDKETGYSDSPDAKYNKLGTTKHLMFAFNELKTNSSLYKRLKKTTSFIEIYADPQKEGIITWFKKGDLTLEEKVILSKYFDEHNSFIEETPQRLLTFVNDCKAIKSIKIRPEIEEKIERDFEQELFDRIKNSNTINFEQLKIEPFDYQKEGVQFATFKKGAIIADEMGLGKTLQGIGAAIAKKEIFDFKKVLIVCPASLKDQWKKEIEKMSHEKALIIEGLPKERERQYFDQNHYFLIANYESILRDQKIINQIDLDFLILDEAQRAKNFETKISSCLKSIVTKHTLILTGTPIENNLIDLFSIVSIFDQRFLGPLWEFSYQHCLFDPVKHNKISGYYNLNELKNRLAAILLRREKKEVIRQLPKVQQIDVPVQLSPLQADYHASYAKGLAKIVRKKFLTPYDMQKLRQLLTGMRMVCNSTYLVDENTNDSPKLEELEYILLNKLNVKNSNRKVIIFSEWIKTHKIIGKLLRDLKIGFVELNGSIPTKLRGRIIQKFENDEHCKIFLSTEAGGSGLNLQVADSLINFELPWNPAKKNQRIGRIDRLGQKEDQLTIFNLISRNSIEERIAVGLLVKQDLFDGALSGSSENDFVDFSNKGRSQFIDQLQSIVEDGFSSVYDEKEEPKDQSIAEQKHNEEESVDLSEEAKIAQDVNDDNNISRENNDGQTKLDTQVKEMEEVMNNGMQFLSGLFKMSTGKNLVNEDQKVEFDQKTGEVTIKFKLPM